MQGAVDHRELLSRKWEYIIIGTGMGGATLGHALAKAGRSVLFLERGRFHNQAPDALTGDWLESLVAKQGEPLTAEHKKRAGRLAEGLVDLSGPEPRPLAPLLGIGAGGSSALFGFVMERFFPSDFTPGRHFRDSPAANVPEAWPISYAELEPYYTKAEALYRVRATRDPLRPAEDGGHPLPPPPLSPANAELTTHLRAQGLHPYHLPVACEHLQGCRECLGYVCPQACKRDSATTCLQPALQDHGAAMLSECEVEALVAEAGRVTAVNARWRGELISLRGKTVVLAAGAVHTPAILLRSGGPHGLANGSDQVGRNLMRHYLDYWIVYPKADPKAGLLKQVAVNDFYLVDGQKLGTLQSNGRFPPASSLAAGFADRLRRRSPILGRLFPLVRPFAELRLKVMMARGYVFAGFVEDLPYAGNRIALGPDRHSLTLSYRIAPQDRARIAYFRKKVAKALGPRHFKTLALADENRVLGHVCGTARFGDDPRTSVLDRNNRAHEVENLYVVDGSFMPTSGGTNPALTIAANALRVADIMLSTPVEIT